MKDDDIKYCLRYLDDDVLREKSENVKSVRTAESELIKALADVMVAHRGVGLAAPQLGVLKRIIVVHPSILPEGADTLFINPEIVWASDDEFPSRGQILFDSSAARHMPLDALGGCVGYAVDCLLNS